MQKSKKRNERKRKKEKEEVSLSLSLTHSHTHTLFSLFRSSFASPSSLVFFSFRLFQPHRKTLTMSSTTPVKPNALEEQVIKEQNMTPGQGRGGGEGTEPSELRTVGFRFSPARAFFSQLTSSLSLSLPSSLLSHSLRPPRQVPERERHPRRPHPESADDARGDAAPSQDHLRVLRRDEEADEAVHQQPEHADGDR